MIKKNVENELIEENEYSVSLGAVNAKRES